MDSWENDVNNRSNGIRDDEPKIRCYCTRVNDKERKLDDVDTGYLDVMPNLDAISVSKEGKYQIPDELSNQIDKNLDNRYTTYAIKIKEEKQKAVTEYYK